MDAIIGIFGQLLWPVVGVLVALAAAWGWGARKKAEGRAQERARAKVAREAAANEATVIREKTASKTEDQQRRDVEQWEQR